MPQNTYPYCYTDPSVTDAEHLTSAAYHLIEAGYSDMAQPLIDQVCEAFEDVSVNMKQKSACKVLGTARYFPCGVITVPGPQCDLSVPAPSYEIDDLADMRKGASKRASMACRRARLGWFSSKQAEAASKQRPPAVAAFRPAAILERVMKICSSWDPGMPPEAASVIAEKLYGVLSKNPIGTTSISGTLYRDLMTHGTGYAYSCDEGVWGFRYLPESQVKIAEGILENDNGDQARALSRLEQEKVTWPVYDGDEIAQARTALEDGVCCYDIYESIPFAGYYRQACESHGGRLYYNTTSLPYLLKDRVMDALDAARDVCNLIRCHEALRRHPDEYLHGTLLKCKMISDELDIPEGLHITAMEAMAARAFILPDGYAGDSEHQHMAFEAVKPLAGVFDLQAAMDHPLLHAASDSN